MAYDYLRLVGDDPAVWDQRDSRPMQMFEIDGIVLSGAEYWPFRGDRPPKYPDDVLWGFYPQQGVVFEGAASVASATPEAIACAERSHAALRDWVEASPAKFRRAVELGASNRFYLWTNDYSQAVTPFPQPVRKNRLWYWQRDPAVVGRVPGFWKWETTLTQAGECLIPEREQIDEYLGQKVRELEKRSRP
jgi:hypothetical protein